MEKEEVGVFFVSFFVFFVFNFIYLFMRDTHREREREREAQTQAEGEAGSIPCREPDVGLDPGSPGPRRGLKVAPNR